MYESEFLIVVGLVFVLAGLVKGIVGFGLPTVSLAFLTILIGLKDAMALIVIPALLTNTCQALSGGAFVASLRRLWPFIVMMFIGVWVGTDILVRSNQIIISGILGGLLLLYSGISLFTPQIPPPGRNEVWLAPSVGGITGIVTGLIGTFVMPGVLYLQALGLPRDVLVQAMGVLFGMASIALGLSLAGQGVLTLATGSVSMGGVVPAIIGMAMGRWARQQLSEVHFRRFFFAALFVLGGYLAGRAFLH